MKERDEQIDQIIRTRLNDYSSSSPEDLWDRIDAQRSKKEDDNGIIWWRWSLAGLAILFVIASVFILTPDISPNANGLTANEVTTPPVGTSNVGDNEEANTTNLVESGTDQDDLLLSIKDVPPIQRNQESAEKTITNAKNISEQKTSVNIFANKNQIPSVAIADNNSQNESLFIENSNSPTNESILTPNTTTLKDHNTQKDYADATSTGETTNSEQAIPSNDFKAIHLESGKITLAATERTVDEDLLEVLPRGCYSFPGGAFKYDFYVDGIVSGGMAFRSLDAKNSDYINYLKNREATESTMFTYSSGVRLSFVTERGLALRTGLIYSQILEKFKYENQNTQQTIIEDIFDVNGNLIRTDTTIVSGTRFKTTYNRYRAFDIPLLLGYEVDSKHFIFNINAGVYFNIWSKQEGELLSASSTALIPIRFNSKNPTAPKLFHDRLGASFYGSVGINYKINDQLQLLIEPNMQYQFHSITVENYPISQKYLNIGLMTGLRLQF